MVALQIRDVPDHVRQTLADNAARRGQSLQAFLLALVTEEADRSVNTAVLARFANRRDGSRLTDAELSDVLASARADRDGTGP